MLRVFYNCDTCGFSIEVGLVPRAYRFPEGDELDMVQRHVWCNHCEAITVTENWTDETFYKRWQRKCAELGEAREKTSFVDLMSPEELAQWIDQCEAVEALWAKFRKQRSKPPFCLVCGNQEIEVPQNRHDDLKHGACGGVLKYSQSFAMGSYIRPKPHQYSIEGELLALGSSRGPFQGDPVLPLELWWQGRRRGDDSQGEVR